MPSKKLLIVTMYFPPCAAVATHRMLGLVRYLPGHDWETIVIAPPHVYHEASDPNLLNLIPHDKTTIYSVAFTEGFWGKVNRKFFPNYLWLIKAYLQCRKIILEQKPDAILTTFPPACTHLLGLWLKTSFNLPWIADFRDPWYSMNDKLVKQPKKLRRYFNKCAEIKTLNKADLIVSTSPSYTKGIQSIYQQEAEKIVTITNGYDPVHFQHNASSTLPKERFTLLYTGELYLNRNPLGLLDALSEIEFSAGEMPKVRFDFIGHFDKNEYDLPKEVKNRRLEQVVGLHGVKPYKECLKETGKADILVLIQNEGYTCGLPAKIFEYIGAQRPILVIADPPGDIEWVLKESGLLHRIAPVRDPAKIKQAILELIFEIKANKPVIQTQNVSFTREAMAKNFASNLDNLMDKHARNTANH